MTEIIPYCTDEDIAVRAGGDLLALVPGDQKIASGSDGVFGVGDRWLLTSAGVDFVARGAAGGNICLLTAPKAVFRVPGDLLAVEAAEVGGLRLRRKGMTAGSGDPPGPIAGATGVEFALLTLGPQISAESYEIDQLYGTDDLVYGRRHADQYDRRQLIELTAIRVIKNQYLSMARSSTNSDHMYAKYGEYKAKVELLEKRLQVMWTNAPPGLDKTSPFGVRALRG